jgi:S1-C subfamily serine protease
MATDYAAAGLRRGIMLLAGGLAAVVAVVTGRAGVPDQVRSGTAFFVSAEGQLLTSAHLVAGCRHLMVWPPDSPGVPAKIISVDHKLDIALVAIPDAAVPHAVPSGMRPPQIDEAVSIIAYGVHRNMPRASEVVAGTVVGAGATSLPARVTVIQATLRPGTSGAPVIDATGTLLGVIIGRYTAAPRFAVAVSVHDLGKFLSRNGVAVAPAPDAERTLIAPADRLSRMSALVQCVPAPTR